jgi:hypothetical protein
VVAYSSSLYTIGQYHISHGGNKSELEINRIRWVKVENKNKFYFHLTNPIRKSDLVCLEKIKIHFYFHFYLTNPIYSRNPINSGHEIFLIHFIDQTCRRFIVRVSVRVMVSVEVKVRVMDGAFYKKAVQLELYYDDYRTIFQHLNFNAENESFLYYHCFYYRYFFSRDPYILMRN